MLRVTSEHGWNTVIINYLIYDNIYFCPVFAVIFSSTSHVSCTVRVTREVNVKIECSNLHELQQHAVRALLRTSLCNSTQLCKHLNFWKGWPNQMYPELTDPRYCSVLGRVLALLTSSWPCWWPQQLPTDVEEIAERRFTARVSSASFKSSYKVPVLSLKPDSCSRCQDST